MEFSEKIDQETQCLFCNISNNQVKIFKVHEDSNSIAFLDINPRSKGMIIIIPKKHFNEMNDEYDISKKLFEVAQKISNKIKEKLKAKNVNLSIINIPDIKHFHIRLYPIYENEKPLIENNPIKISEDELKNIAAELNEESVEYQVEEKEDIEISESKIETIVDDFIKDDHKNFEESLENQVIKGRRN